MEKEAAGAALSAGVEPRVHSCRVLYHEQQHNTSKERGGDSKPAILELMSMLSTLLTAMPYTALIRYSSASRALLSLPVLGKLCPLPEDSSGIELLQGVQNTPY